MRKIIFFLIGTAFFGLILIDCQKSGNSDLINDVVITGYDARDCVCCGGLMINFENDPIPYSGEFYLVDKLPVNSVIGSDTKFPLYARVTWKYSTMKCGSTQFVDIIKLELK